MDMPEPPFAEFYGAHFQRIAVQLYAYLGDHAEAQDLAQEAFCRALQQWSRISRFDDPAGWVRRVAWNLATSRLRRLQTALGFLARQREQHVEGPGPDRVALVAALAKLPAGQRRALVLYHLGELGVAEIAQQEGVAEGTVRSWLTRGRAKLAAQLTPEVWHA
jgi:RNA polymerase sigma-70 factor (ECF subfamily)